MPSAVNALKKAWEAKGVANDAFTLKKFFNKFEEGGKAQIILTGIESKYVAKYDKRDEEGSMGYRTRFFTEKHGSIGTFSNGAHMFFELFANLMGQRGDENFNHIDINGRIVVEVSEVDLGGGRSTYNFEIVEEGSNLAGMEQYIPTLRNILTLPDGRQVDSETGSVIDAADAESEA